MTFRFDLFPVVTTDDNSRANAKLFLLLSAVRETGSLHRASQQAGISYRHAWGLMRSWEDLLGQGILDMERGRGASLTRFGERLLRAEQRLREAIDPVVNAATSRFMADLDEAAQPQALVHFTGSHDPVVEMLSAALQQGPAHLHLDAVFCGGAEGLICLQERQSELAGFHVAPIQASGSVVHITLRKWLRDSTVRLLHVASRERGLIVAPRRAADIGGLPDLVRSGATFLNRQRSSGTRVLFDQLRPRTGCTRIR